MVDKPEITADAHSAGPIIDPTKNVLDKVDDAVQRQDDLREALKLYVDTRLDGIAHEFILVESRRQEQKIDTKTAVDAALSAAEKAVREAGLASEKSIIKSETAAAEASKQNAQTFAAAIKGVTDTLNDVKDRVGKIENMAQGRHDSRSDNQSNIGMLIGIASFVVAAIAVLYALLKP